jgi:hypothetical protein
MRIISALLASILSVIVGCASLPTPVEAPEPGVWKAVDFKEGSPTGGIQEALTACKEFGGGIVYLPPYLVEIDAENMQSPIIELPYVSERQHSVGLCELRGYGSGNNSVRKPDNMLTGSTVRIVNSALSLPDPNGYRTGIQMTGSSQYLEHFSLIVEGGDSSTRGILCQSLPHYGRERGEAGVGDWELKNVYVLGSNLGVGIELQFCLRGKITGGNSQGWETGLKFNQVPSGLNVKNNGVILTGMSLRSNLIGLELTSVHSCGELLLQLMAIEGNERGIVIHNNADCRVTDISSHYEQIYPITPIENRANIYINTRGSKYVGIGVGFGGTVLPGRDIVRTKGFPRYGKDVLVGSNLMHGVTYETNSDLILFGMRYIAGLEGRTFGNDHFTNPANCPAYGSRTKSNPAGAMCWQENDGLKSKAGLYICLPEEGAGMKGLCDIETEWKRIAKELPIEED